MRTLLLAACAVLLAAALACEQVIQRTWEGFAGQAVPAATSTTLATASAAAQPGSPAVRQLHPGNTSAPDQPLPYGPGPLLWSDHGTVYRAAHYLSAWNPSARCWQAVSPDLTEAYQPGRDGAGIDGISALAACNGAWYAGTLVGHVAVKLPGSPWRVVSSDLPARTVTAIAVCPAVPGGRMAAVGYGGYSSATPLEPGHVYVTFDGGAHWNDLTGDLPDLPVQSVHFAVTDGRTTLLVELENCWYRVVSPEHWAVVSPSAAG
ncbi:MAG: hypothetical protein IRZ33_07765 [Alicyclobacillaceae bacterium]|nr:hypothetical protein [Alicyclobacillaceae bacterium]